MLYHQTRRDSGRLANEASTSNPIVSSKQWLSGLKIINWKDQTLRIQLLEEGIMSKLEWTEVKGSVSKLWKPRDLLEIINVSKIITNENFPSFTEAFEHKLSFCQMYNFLKMHKEVAYNSDIPHSFCLCEVRENTSLLAKGINSSLKSSDALSLTAHDLVETHTCDSSSKTCRLGNCP